jgi:hypothetical protein
MYKRSSRFNNSRKKQEGKNSKFSIFNPHDTINPSMNEGWIQVGSIDPAIYNFALRVERWYPDGKIETIFFSHTNFTISDDKKVPEVGKENFYYVNSLNILQEFCSKYLEQCHYICIESQLSFAYDMVRISSHIISAMCVYLKDKGNRPLILEIDPKLKTKLLGAPPMRKKKDVKNWCINKAFELFKAENDTESLQFMNRMKATLKADDVGDTKCQLQAMIVLLKEGSLPKTNNDFNFSNEIFPINEVKKIEKISLPRKNITIKIIS